MAHKTGRRKVFVGTVVSDKMDKTRVVQVRWMAKHKMYAKPVRQASKFKAHDEASDARVGDLVRIRETRPLSKTKRWRLVEIIKRAD